MDKFERIGIGYGHTATDTRGADEALGGDAASPAGKWADNPWILPGGGHLRKDVLLLAKTPAAGIGRSVGVAR